MSSLWSDDGEKVEVLKEDKCTSLCDILTLFIEYLVLDFPKTAVDGSDYYESAEVKEIIGAVNSGEDELVLLKKREIYKLFIYLLYTGKFSICRFRNIIMSLYGEKKFKNGKKLMKEAERVVNEKRTTSSLISLRLQSEFMMPYLYDLKTAILDVPEGMSFVLGDKPLLSFFSFNVDVDSLFAEPEKCNGIIFILPVSPRRAICVYDGFVYRIRKNKGRVIINRDDVDVINIGVMKISANIVIKRTEICNEQYFGTIMNKMTAEEFDKYEFSFLNIIQRSESVKGKDYRPYAEKLMMFDEREKTDTGRKEYIERILSEKDF